MTFRFRCPPVRRRSAWLAAAALVLAIASPVMATPTVPRSPQLFERIGTLSKFAADTRPALGKSYRPLDGEDETGSALLLTKARQIWQFYPNVTDGNARTTVLVRNLDSNKIIKTLDLPYLRRATFVSGGDWMWAQDPGKRLFLYDQSGSVLAIDLRSFAVTTYSLEPLQLAARTAYFAWMGGLAYDPYSNAIVLVYGGAISSSVANTNTVFLRLDLASKEVTGPRKVRACTGPLPTAENVGVTYSTPMVIPNEQFLYLPCTRAGMVQAIVRLPRADLMSPASAETFVTGPVGVESVLPDHETGNLYTMTTAGAIWVFDASAMAYVGTVAAAPERRVGQGPDRGGGSNIGAGVDEDTGQLFFLAPLYGLSVVEARLFPVPQARSDSALAAAGRPRIFSDSRTRRLFVMKQDGAGYDIYRTPPVVLAPPGGNADAGTVDVAERAGVTESSFGTTASGYGARALLTNGVIPLLPIPTAGGGAGDDGADLFVKQLTSRCWFSDRDLFVGRVAKTEADGGSTAAEAIAAQLDDRSKLDLEQPSRCDPSVNNADGNAVIKGIFNTTPGGTALLDEQVGPRSKWEREPAACTQSLPDAPKPGLPDDHGSQPLGSSEVRCAVPDGKNVTTARAEGFLTGAIAVGRSKAWTEIRREPRGIVSTAHAVASDITIAGDITIAEVASSASSVSNGRPGKAAASEHKTSIKGLTIAGQSICAGECDAKQAQDALNLIAAGRVQFRVGSGASDPRLLQGSPGGAVTAVQKSPQRQFSDRALLGDSTSEVPALEMIVYNDNSSWGTARQVYQFAGVATSATYNIVMVPTGLPLPDLEVPELPRAGELPPGGTGPSGPGPIPDSGDNPVPQADGDQPPTLAGAPAALGRGLRLLLTDPRHALLMLTVWLLLGLPVLLARRRHLLRQVWAT